MAHEVVDAIVQLGHRVQHASRWINDQIACRRDHDWYLTEQKEAESVREKTHRELREHGCDLGHWRETILEGHWGLAIGDWPCRDIYASRMSTAGGAHGGKTRLIPVREGLRSLSQSIVTEASLS